ncbi:MAG: DUF1569 domain-containing protein [Crocinitomicaceae bacterium]|tara:strand:+ start:13695 stop:14150 length:456 start_codon:yes stop_codon:yes gene_type:complete
MLFLEPTLENFQKHIAKLKRDKEPLWGTMSAERMVEHLTESLDISMGKAGDNKLEIPLENVGKAQAFLFSEYPLPKNFKDKFLPSNTSNRNAHFQLAISEFENKWVEFENFFIKNPGFKALHPSFGNLNHKQYLALHCKHMTHHFEQFELI